MKEIKIKKFKQAEIDSR